MDRILSTEPWRFDKSLVVTQRFDKNSSIEELNFDKASFWVQVHDIPIRYRNRSVAKVSVIPSARFIDLQKILKAGAGVTWGYEFPWMSINLYSVEGSLNLRKGRKFGWASNTSSCLTSVTGADVLIMGIKIVTFGSRVRALCKYHLNSMVHGFVLHQLFPPTTEWYRFRVTIRTERRTSQHSGGRLRNNGQFQFQSRWGKHKQKRK